jgi:hypothetical protein
MKRITALLVVLAFAGVILLPVTTTVNHTFSNENLVADGMTGPTPPIPPCVFASATAVQA